MSYLGEEIAATINNEFKDIVYSATLTKVTPGTRTSGSLTSGTNPTTTAYTCKGYISTFNDTQFPNTLVQNGDRAVVLLAESLTVVPTPGDKVTIQSNTYTIREKGVERDPSTSIYKLHCGVN